MANTQNHWDNIFCQKYVRSFCSAKALTCFWQKKYYHKSLSHFFGKKYYRKSFSHFLAESITPKAHHIFLAKSITAKAHHIFLAKSITAKAHHIFLAKSITAKAHHFFLGKKYYHKSSSHFLAKSITAKAPHIFLSKSCSVFMYHTFKNLTSRKLTTLIALNNWSLIYFSINTKQYKNLDPSDKKNLIVWRGKIPSYNCRNRVNLIKGKPSLKYELVEIVKLN